MIYSIKKMLLKHISGRLNGYVKLLIRKCYTSLHQGVDIKIDDSIKYIALSKIYEIDKEEIELNYYDEDKISDILTKITEKSKERIAAIKKEYEKEIAVIKDDNFDGKLESKSKLKKLSIISLTKKTYVIEKYFHNEYEYFKEKNRIKITIPLDKVGLLLALFTPIIVIGSLIQQYVLAREFNYPLEMVFGTSDYISASISSIMLAIVPIVITIVLVVWANLSDLSKDPVSMSKADEAMKKDRKWFYLWFLVLTVFTYIYRREMFWIFIEVYAFFLLMIIAKVFLKYIKNVISVLLVMVFTLLFSMNMLNSSIINIKDIKSDNPKVRYKIENKDGDTRFADTRIVVIGSKNIVLWDQKTNQVILVRPDLIDIVNIY